MKIKIVDAVMGSGKTSAAINYINSLEDTEKILVIVPYLDEADRIMSSCKGKRFRTPGDINKDNKNGITKTNHILKLITNGENIVSTHALFQRFNDEIIEAIKDQEYILVMDEVTNVIQECSETDSDMDLILNNCAHVDLENNKIVWDDDKYVGKFSNFRSMCQKELINGYILDDRDENDAPHKRYGLLWSLPVEFFDSFKEVWVLTYMFDAQIQRYYFDYFGVEYEHQYVVKNEAGEYRFTSENPGTERSIDYSKLIRIYRNENLNEIGDSQYALSANYFKNPTNINDIVVLKNNLYNFFRHKTKTKASQNLWTTYLLAYELLKGCGYSKGFIALNTRATNKYRDRTAVAYAANRYMNPSICMFFRARGIEVDQDRYALSEMLQFIWRSAIRDGKPIDLYVPSLRMRKLLEDWIIENSPEGIDFKRSTQISKFKNARRMEA